MNGDHEDNMEDTGPGPDLVALVSSRLCHDLASPLGALSTGMEFLEMSAGAPTEEMALLRSSVDTANARLRFFRVAFGGGGEDGPIGAAEARGIVATMYRESRRRVDWSDEVDRPRSEIKLAFLALACLETATPWPAAISVVRHGDRWAVEAQADRLKPLDGLWTALAARRVPGDLPSHEVHFGLLARALSRSGRPIGVAVESRSIVLTF